MRSIKQYAVPLTLLLMPGLYPVPVQAAPSTGGDISSLLTMNLEQLLEVDVAIATGTSKSIRTAPAVATVITAEDIEAIGATTLDEALETVPGLHVAPSKFNRLNSVYSIRGIHTGQNPQVVLLIDGSRITWDTGGNRLNTFDLPVEDIARIEVIRGPGSAVYGADAFAGVINVITKSAADLNGVKTGVRAGSFGAADTWLQYGGTKSGWEVTSSLEFLHSDGDSDRVVDSDLQTALDQVINIPFGLPPASVAPGPLETQEQIVTGRLGLKKDHWSMRVWGWAQDDGGEGAGVAQALDPEGGESNTIAITDLIYRNADLVKNWDLSLAFNYTYFRVDSYLVLLPPGTMVPIGSDGNINFAAPKGLTYFPDGVIGHPLGEENHNGVTFSSYYSGVDSHRWRFDLGFRHVKLEAWESKNFGPGGIPMTGGVPPPVQDGTLTDVSDTPDVFCPDLNRDSWFALLQDEWAFAPRWELTGGGRYDRYSDFGSTVNPRLALVWETLDELTTKLLYGRAFRAPSFVESFYVNNPTSLGNPNLDPETINTLELAFDYRPLSSLRTGLNLFAYKIKDLIEFVPDANQTTSTAQNARDQKGRGFEVEMDWKAAKTLRFRYSFAYQRSKDPDTGEITPDAPEMKHYVNGHWDFYPDWSLDGQYYWIGDRHRAKGDTRPDIKDNNIVNLTLRRKNVAEHWTAALAVRNLFDENVREPSQPSIPNDYPMESRAIWGELRYSF